MYTHLANQYSELVSQIGKLIDISGYRNDYLAKKIGMKSANFSIKKQRGNWNIQEVQKLVPVLERSEDVEDYLFIQAMEATKNDELVPIEEIKKEVIEKLESATDLQAANVDVTKMVQNKKTNYV